MPNAGFRASISGHTITYSYQCAVCCLSDFFNHFRTHPIMLPVLVVIRTGCAWVAFTRPVLLPIGWNHKSLFSQTTTINISQVQCYSCCPIVQNIPHST